MKRILVLTLILLLAPCAAALAQNNGTPAVGQNELHLLEIILTGSIGMGIGLLVTAIGIYRVAMGSTRGGIILILLGAMVTVLPGIYNGVRDITCGIAAGFGGQCGQ